jgi:hypothetical protein
MSHLPLRGGGGDKAKKGEGKGKDHTPKGGGGIGQGYRSGNGTPGYDKTPAEIPCRFMYAFGSCKKGTDCDFAHRTPSATEIKEYGFYKNGPAKQGDGKGKTKGTCTSFADSGSCRFGNKCIFSHGDKSKAKGKSQGETRATTAPADEGEEEWNIEETCDDGWYGEE